MDLTRNFRGKLFGKRGEELNNTPHTGMDMYFKLAKSVRVNLAISFYNKFNFSFNNTWT